MKNRTYFAMPADILVGESLADYAKRKAALPRCANTKAPGGWYCSRIQGHEGPCAAHQVPRDVFVLVRQTPAGEAESPHTPAEVERRMKAWIASL